MTENGLYGIYAQASVTARRIDLGRKTLDQYLEQLCVAVRYRERESALEESMRPTA